MSENIDYVRPVKRAQHGDEECLDRLARAASERLRVNAHLRIVLQEQIERLEVPQIVKIGQKNVDSLVFNLV